MVLQVLSLLPLLSSGPSTSLYTVSVTDLKEVGDAEQPPSPTEVLTESVFPSVQRRDSLPVPQSLMYDDQLPSACAGAVAARVRIAAPRIDPRMTRFPAELMMSPLEFPFGASVELPRSH
ncbi:hypothetical protein M877_06195 [Streptomyces niveus NCIMB 11891]|nr:hypothetical protein M877_06195 [Streptomyces niveus NCIMB 11891]